MLIDDSLLLVTFSSPSVSYNLNIQIIECALILSLKFADKLIIY